MFTEVAGMKIYYTECGSGAPVLLLHGWGASSDSWKGVMSVLSGSCRLVAPDLPGCGQSDLPKRALCINDYLAFVMDFCNNLGLKDPILIGHSHGCRIIMKLCGTGLMHPPKIVMIDGAGIKPKFNFKKTLKIYSFKTVKRILTLPVIKGRTEGLLNKARSHFGSADYSSAPEVMRQTMVKLVNDDMTPYLDGITAPTLLIWGECDTATPLYMAQKIEKIIPDCGLCVIKGAGHWSFVERPGEALPIIKSFIP